MDIDKLVEGIEQAEPSAIATAKDGVKARSFNSVETHRIWEGAIKCYMKTQSSAVVRLGLELNDMHQEPESREMYEALFTMVAIAKGDNAFSPTIRSGAAIAKLTSGRIPPGMDAERYLAIAKPAFLKVLDEGKEVTKKYAIEALRHIQDYEVRGILTDIARNSDIESLKAAAGDSMCHIRSVSEVEKAKEDKAFLLEMEYPDPTSPQMMYVETIYSAIDFALDMKRGDEESIRISITLMQLISFSEKPSQMEDIFPTDNDRDNLQRIETSVENALFHVLNIGSPTLKKKAADGLVKLGTGAIAQTAESRVKDVLDTIVRREGETSDVGKIAAEALSRITAYKKDVFTLPQIRLPVHADSRKATSAADLRKPAR